MLEHLNVQIPDQVMATSFYVSGLGPTRDPCLNTRVRKIWIDVGKSQFHLPTGEPWLFAQHHRPGDARPRRHCSIGWPGSKTSSTAASSVSPSATDYVEVTCTWGNRFRLRSPEESRFGAFNLGMPYVEFDVPSGTAD